MLRRMKTYVSRPIARSILSCLLVFMALGLSQSAHAVEAKLCGCLSNNESNRMARDLEDAAIFMSVDCSNYGSPGAKVVTDKTVGPVKTINFSSAASKTRMSWVTRWQREANGLKTLSGNQEYVPTLSNRCDASGDVIGAGTKVSGTAVPYVCFRGEVDQNPCSVQGSHTSTSSRIDGLHVRYSLLQ
jgi:hypothetical protein